MFSRWEPPWGVSAPLGDVEGPSSREGEFFLFHYVREGAKQNNNIEIT